MDENQKTADAPEPDIRPMRELPDFKAADGDPDVRGWTVHTPDGAEVGRVHEMMVDLSAMRVRDIEVVLAPHGDRLMVPVEQMQADAEGKRVVVPAITRTPDTAPRADT